MSYDTWLRDSHHQADKEQKQRAGVAAACLLRGIWILNGRPNWVSGVKFEYSDYLQNLDAYRDAFIEFEERIHKFIKGYLISDGMWEDAKKNIEKLNLDEILKLSSPMF
jgi:hypothetical protein